MTEQRLREILEGISHLSVGIIGDFCLDAYWELDTSNPELSVETGKPTRAVTHQRYNPGGAGNIAENIIRLGARSVSAFGVIGNDLFGREMRTLLLTHGVTIDGMIPEEADFDTPVYAKPFVEMEEQERIDFGRCNTIDAHTEAKVLEHLRHALPHLHALIINQQLLNGVCSPRMLANLNDLALEFPAVVMIADSRHRSDLLHNMIRKLNTAEALLSSQYSDDQNIVETLRSRALEIARSTNHPVFITRGHDGILACDGIQFFEIPAAGLSGGIDPVGAGDTTVAAIASALASGATVKEAAELGNLAGAVTVQKLHQTGTASPDEIISTFLRQS